MENGTESLKHSVFTLFSNDGSLQSVVLPAVTGKVSESSVSSCAGKNNGRFLCILTMPHRGPDLPKNKEGWETSITPLSTTRCQYDGVRIQKGDKELPQISGMVSLDRDREPPEDCITCDQIQ